MDRSVQNYAGEAFATAASRRDVPGTYLGTDLIRAAGLVDEGPGIMREVGASASSAPWATDLPIRAPPRSQRYPPSLPELEGDTP